MMPSSFSDYGVLAEDIELDSPLASHPSKLLPIPITSKQKLYVLGMQGVGGGLVNVVINAALAYLMYGQGEGSAGAGNENMDTTSLPNTMRFTGDLTCVVSDVIVTAFLIPCLTTVIATMLIRNDLRMGKLITPIDRRHLDHPFFYYIPTGLSWIEIIKRAILFGFIGVVAFAPVTLLIIYLITGTNGMQVKWSYVIFKGFWSGLEAAIFSPLIAFIAVAQQVPSHHYHRHHTDANADVDIDANTDVDANADVVQVDVDANTNIDTNTDTDDNRGSIMYASGDAVLNSKTEDLHINFLEHTKRM